MRRVVAFVGAAGTGERASTRRTCGTRTLGAGPRTRRAGKVESLFTCPSDEQMILFISSMIFICLISHAVAKCADIILCFFP